MSQALGQKDVLPLSSLIKELSQKMGSQTQGCQPPCRPLPKEPCVCAPAGFFWGWGPPGISTLRAPREHQATSQHQPGFLVLRPPGGQAGARSAQLAQAGFLPPTNQPPECGRGTRTGMGSRARAAGPPVPPLSNQAKRGNLPEDTLSR